MLASGVPRQYDRCMNNMYTAAFAASILALAAPASAYTSEGPIQVQTVYGSQDFQAVPGVLRIEFENTADSAARAVTFLVNDTAGNQTEVEDIGTFAKGVTIRHDFRLAEVTNGATASVLHVELADGSSWDAPTATESESESQPQAAAIPNLPTIDYSL